MIYNALRWLLRRLYRIEITGDERVFRQSKLLITPNHTSFMDGVLLALFLPLQEKPIFAVYSSIADRWFMTTRGELSRRESLPAAYSGTVCRAR